MEYLQDTKSTTFGIPIMHWWFQVGVFMVYFFLSALLFGILNNKHPMKPQLPIKLWFHKLNMMAEWRSRKMFHRQWIIIICGAYWAVFFFQCCLAGLFVDVAGLTTKLRSKQSRCRTMRSMIFQGSLKGYIGVYQGWLNHQRNTNFHYLLLPRPWMRPQIRVN